jgi:hypothetical protein
MLRIKLLAVFTLLFVCLMSEAQNQRFIDRVFSQVSVTQEIYFSSGDNYLGNNKDLYFDFYEPFGDTMELRPLVIEVFGGSFVAGNRQWADMQAYGDSLASYGYTVAAIDYRLGYNPLSQSSLIRAAYRACQDVNASIRFFKANYLEYGIDTTQIFLLGNSAGSIASLMSVYLDDEERPEDSFGGFMQSDLECLNCTGDYQNRTTDVAGIIAQWGGLDKLEYIEQDDTTSICFIHGTGDVEVPYDYGTPYNVQLFPTLYGSLYLSMRLDTLNIEHELHLFEGASHAFYLEDLTDIVPDSFNICLNITLNFLAQNNIYVNETVFADNVYNSEYKIYPNPVDSKVFIEAENETFSYKLFSSEGRLLLESIAFSKAEIYFGNYPAGIFFIEIKTKNKLSVEKLIHY